MMSSDIGKFILLAGVVLIVVGIFVLLLAKVPFLGKLPGDIQITKGNFSFYFPVVTCIVLSIIVTAIFNLFLKK